MRQPRALFLRTFRGSQSDHLLAAAIAKELQGGHLVIMGNRRARNDLAGFWAKSSEKLPPFSSCIDYVVSDDRSWRRQVHRQIVDAEIIVVFFSPKGEGFPRINNAPAARLSETDYTEFLERVYATPLSGHMSGTGLLHELCYVQRLGAIPKTITICRQPEFNSVKDRIELAEFGSHGIAHSATLDKVLAPRLTALDQQLRWLSASYGPIPFQDPVRGIQVIKGLHGHLSDAFDDVLSGRAKSRYLARWGRLEHGYPSGAPDSMLPLGKSRHPRTLPPDHKLKILRHWNAEDLIEIPIGEITDLPARQARRHLSPVAIKRGCPYCHAPVGQLCFHSYGLASSSNNSVRAKCQNCGRRSSLWDDMLMDM